MIVMRRRVDIKVSNAGTSGYLSAFTYSCSVSAALFVIRTKHPGFTFWKIMFVYICDLVLNPLVNGHAQAQLLLSAMSAGNASQIAPV